MDQTHIESIKNIVGLSRLSSFLRLDSESTVYHFDPYTKVALNQENEAVIIPYSSSYVAVGIGLEDKINFSNRVEYNLLRRYSGSYLNQELRNVKGISYGARVDIGINTLLLSVYRDTDIGTTKQVLDNLGSYMKEQSSKVSEKDDLEVRIGFISSLELYKNPRQHAFDAFLTTLGGVTEKDLEANKTKALSTDLKSLLLNKASEIESAYSKSKLTVFEGREIIEKDKGLFTKIE